MKINKIIVALSFFSALGSYSADTLDFDQVTVGTNPNLPFKFKTDRPVTIEKIKGTQFVEANISITSSELENAQIKIAPNQNVEFNGAAFAFVKDDKGNQFTIPAHIKATPNYTEAYNEVSYNKYGDELILSLRNYLAGVHKTYDYDKARDMMYGYVDNYNGIVECPYTGKTIATTTRPLGTADFDTEHTWPQAFGAEQAPERTDMFHMRPSWKAANNKRGNCSFGDVVTSVPSPQGYSEGGSELGKNAAGTLVFEVRDAFKGDIARGVLYFALRYGNKANNNNPDDKFLDSTQYAVLNQWHTFDKPNQIDYDRNSRIKEKQFSENPFIEHPEIIDRMNLIGTYTRPQYSFSADSMIVFTNATELPVYFYNDLNTKLEYANVSGDDQFTIAVADSNANGSAVYNIKVQHSVSETAHNATLKVKFVDSPEYTIILRSDATNAVNDLPNSSNEVMVYPNPAKDFALIKYSVDNLTADSPTIKFFDASGKTLNPTITYATNGNSVEIKVSTNSLTAGQVFFNLEINGKVHSGIINITK